MAAQRTRYAKPEAMDIYDIVKEKGIKTVFLQSNPDSWLYLAPSCGMIQQQLILEESGEGSVHGQTSWISSGLKIQEMQ